ncbi:hypothetical protein [Natrialbaceae archaeon AArc-T1-2]|uniref:hypothetical protein n=1 Tax=Natrialbaceae archaeon AArc-T1-2 TaxID=3053904 RepID=UPI00255A8DF4|nr:hypothetical protein [Natrialbaceae archaeon AArc-T1-2]WIV66560.1 hypothetical protein QQ977_12785 [Natrialbaceae archaeon AArc-T1-2]
MARNTEIHDTVGIDRRTFMKASAASALAAGALASGASGSVAAQEDGSSVYDRDPWGFDGEEQSTASTYVMSLMDAFDASSEFTGGEPGFSTLCDWLYGEFDPDDPDDPSSVEAAAYHHGRGVRDVADEVWLTLHEIVEDVENHAITAAVRETARALEENRSESEARGLARGAAIEAMIPWWTAGVMQISSWFQRAHDLAEAQRAAGASENEVTIRNAELSGLGDARAYDLIEFSVSPLDTDFDPFTALALVFRTPEDEDEDQGVEYEVFSPFFHDNWTDDESNNLIDYTSDLESKVDAYEQSIDEDYDNFRTNDRQADGTSSGTIEDPVRVEQLDADNGEFGLAPRDAFAELFDSGEFSNRYILPKSFVTEFNDRVFETRSAVEDLVSDAYAVHERGLSLPFEDMIEPSSWVESVSKDWMDTSHDGFAASLAAWIGYATNLELDMTVNVGGETVEGVLAAGRDVEVAEHFDEHELNTGTFTYDDEELDVEWSTHTSSDDAEQDPVAVPRGSIISVRVDPGETDAEITEYTFEIEGVDGSFSGEPVDLDGVYEGAIVPGQLIDAMGAEGDEHTISGEVVIEEEEGTTTRSIDEVTIELIDDPEEDWRIGREYEQMTGFVATGNGLYEFDDEDVTVESVINADGNTVIDGWIELPHANTQSFETDDLEADIERAVKAQEGTIEHHASSGGGAVVDAGDGGSGGVSLAAVGAGGLGIGAVWAFLRSRQ